MRRFSQRNSLVTLNDINITPLLDLAFVLLIIFVITTPLLEKGMDINLPSSECAAGSSRQPDKSDIRTVDITSQGQYAMNRRAMTHKPSHRTVWTQDHNSNPNLVVNIRADGSSYTRYLAALMDACSKNGITRYSIRTEPISTQ